MTSMIDRRALMRAGLAGAAGLSLGLPSMRALAAPPTNLNMFIPANPGGGWDQTGRSIELAMRTDGIVQNFQFENKGGAGGTVGLPVFLNRKGQGDTLMVGGMVMIGAIISQKSPVKLSDTTPIARLTSEAQVVVVPEASPLKSMADLIAAYKADPKKVSWGGGSAGGTDHIMAVMIAKAIGGSAKDVAYVAFAGGGPAQAALLGNQVTCGISGYGEFAEQIKAGKLRALAVSSDKPLEGVPIKTLKDQGVDVELMNWRGVFGAPGITTQQRDDLVGLIDRMVKGPTWKSELEKKDWNAYYLTGDAFAKYIETEFARIGAILKDIGLA